MTEQQWISVRERLPEHGAYILTYHKPEQGCCDGRQAVYYNSEYGFGDVHDCSPEQPQVTHWMPLPAPPQSSGQEGDGR